MHIAFVTRKTLACLLDGSQTCESRLSINLHPARLAQPGDVLLFKCGDGRAIAKVKRVDVYRDLTPDDIDELRQLYGEAVDGRESDLEYWAAKRRSRHAVFLWLGRVRPVHVPAALLPSTQSAWVANFDPTEEIKAHLRQSLQRPRRGSYQQAALAL